MAVALLAVSDAVALSGVVVAVTVHSAKSLDDGIGDVMTLLSTSLLAASSLLLLLLMLLLSSSTASAATVQPASTTSDF